MRRLLYQHLYKMRFKQQTASLSVKSWDVNSLGGVSSRHGLLLPNNIRCLVCGPSGCGKTNLLLTLLLESKGLVFENVYLYSKSLNQPKYIFLNNVFSHIPEINFYTFTDKNEVASPEDVQNNSVIIFDDVSMEDQEPIRLHFSMGRHKGLDCFYLCQTYSKIPKQLVRDNANFIVLFKQDETNLRHAYDDHVNTDMSWDTFLKLCRECWKDKYGFIVINKEEVAINKGRYRKGFDNFIILD